MLPFILHRLVMVGAVIVALVYLAPAPAFADDDTLSGSGAATEAAPATTRAVKVGLNKSVVIDLPRDARDILVSNPIIADAVIRTPRRIYVTGVAIGQSNVIIFDREGRQILSLELEVERDSINLVRTLNRLIPDSAIDVEIISDNIVLTGTVRNAADARKAEDIANIFVNGGAQSLGGVAVTDNAPASSVVNMLNIQGEDQVQLKVTVAEVQRSVAKQLGIQISGSLDLGVLTAGIETNPGFAGSQQPSDFISGGITSGGNSLEATLRALERTGMIKTLAEPTLTAISGEPASFLAGGEFPVQTRDDNGAVAITFKSFGVQLGFTPVVLSEGRISLHVKTEVSALSSEGASDAGPSLTVRRAESAVELPSGGSLVLAGLLQDNVRQSLGAIPGLGRLPILGTLFRSRDYQRDETELVVIVTPYLVSPVARSALATPDQGYAPASDAQATFLGNINRVYGGPSDKPPSYARRSLEGGFGFIFE